MTKPNYQKFWGKNNQGKTKKPFTKEITNHLNNSGITIARDAKPILNKIKHIEDSFCKAHNFTYCDMGAGIQKGQGETAFHNVILAICLYYCDLEEVMVD